MEEMEGKSALTIQRFWRGYRARRNFHQQRQFLKEYKAAVVIQRAVSIYFVLTLGRTEWITALPQKALFILVLSM